MGNKRSRRLRRVEPRSADGEESLSDASIMQGNATLINVSENADNVFDRNLGSELTEPSQVSNVIEIVSQRLTEQINTKMSQIEKHPNSKFEEILKEIRVYKNCNREKDNENCDPGPSIFRNEHLKKKHASNKENNRDRINDNRFPSSDMEELRQPSTLLGVANETLEDTVMINENRQEADYHMVTGPTKNILSPSSTNSTITDTQGQHPDQSSHEHHEQSDPVSQIAQAIEKLARKNPEPSFFHPKTPLLSMANYRKMRSLNTSRTSFIPHLKCKHTLRKKRK